MVDNVGRTRPVQVDKVQVANPGVLKFHRYLQGILIVDFFRIICSPGQAYTLAVDQVNCRYYSHRVSEF